MDKSTCKGCKREIRWAITAKGKKVPLDPPERRYIEKIERVDGIDQPVVVMRETFMPHHATCPEVEKFRKKKGETDGQASR